MKRLINILILVFSILLLYLLINGIINYQCIFKRIFKIICPGCGLTRSFRAILSLDLISSIRYNILGIPLFILFIIFIVMFIKDIILNEDKALKLIYKILSKYYILILFVLGITMIINNINGI